MEKLNSQENKQNSKNDLIISLKRNRTSETLLEAATATLGAINASIMVVIGYLNLPVEYRYSDKEILELPEEDKRDPCPNGAAYWLYIAGIIFLFSNFLFAWSIFYKWFAKRDGKLDRCEKFTIMLNRFVTGSMTVVQFSMIIWGSVVVFGAWANWTDDFAAFEKDPVSMNYCMYLPMMIAFVLLILEWTLVPLMLVLMCLCLFCCCCCTMCVNCNQIQNGSNQNHVKVVLKTLV